MFSKRFAGSLPMGDRGSEVRAPADHSTDTVPKLARQGSRLPDVLQRVPCGTRAEPIRDTGVRR